MLASFLSLPPALVLLCLSLVFSPAIPLVSAASSSSFLPIGFQFNYDKPNTQLSSPVTGQCEQIQITWGRTNNETALNAPSPVAPYFLQVYHSASNTPYIINAGFRPPFVWDVPFAPSTQYQICMFDSQGLSGGCQQTYTMIPNITLTTNGNSTSTQQPSCQNVTSPTLLPVVGSTPYGALGNFSYIDQCTTLSVTPQGGRAPYQMTIAPDFHAPFNITSNSGDAIQWKVALPVGFRFFVSLASEDGSMWSTGPLRVGGVGPTDCLASGVLTAKTAGKIIAGSSIGGLVLGALLAAASYYAFLRIRDARRPPSRAFRGYSDESSRPLKAFSQGAPSIVGASTLSSIPLTSTMGHGGAGVGRMPSSLSRLRDATPPAEVNGAAGVSGYTQLDYTEPPTPPPPRALRPVRHRSSVGGVSSNGDNHSTTSGGTSGNGNGNVVIVPGAPRSEFSHVSTPSSGGFTMTSGTTGMTGMTTTTLRTVNGAVSEHGVISLDDPATPPSRNNTATTNSSGINNSGNNASTTYPPDIKRRIPPSNTPAAPPPPPPSSYPPPASHNHHNLFSDTASLASTASYSATAQAPRDHRNRFSAVSRAPTYAPNPPRGGATLVYVIDESLSEGGGGTPGLIPVPIVPVGGAEGDLPPEYGRHVEDSPSPPVRRPGMGPGSAPGSANSTPRRPPRPLPDASGHAHVRGDSQGTDVSGAGGSRSLNRF